MHHEDITPQDFERFWSKVDTSAGVNGCWRYNGHHWEGYARLGFHGHQVRGHVFAFISILGDPPPHWPRVLHRCPGGANSWCVNPSHHYPGTQAQNVLDTERDGRTARGDRHPHTKLPDTLVIALRDALAAGAGVRQLARQHHVHSSTISRIKTGLRRRASDPLGS